MNKILLTAILVLFLTSCSTEQTNTNEPITIQQEAKTMILTSKDFENEDQIPKDFTCQGTNKNPHLKWEDAPSETKSFALIVDDPDAPTSTWTHWLVYDIPADVAQIPQNSVPGKQVTNDLGKEEYGGPCPPTGTHRYFFKLYALDIESLTDVTKDNFLEKIEKHTLAKAELMGTYKKEK